MRQRSIAFLFCVVATTALGAQSNRLPQPTTGIRAVSTNALRPTVTKEMGDVGGKFFGQTPDPAKTKHYYIAVEPELWNYVPEGRDVICGRPLPPEIQQGGRALKWRYVQYTDETFTTLVLSEPRLGLLGPVLRGTVGQYLAVTLLNRLQRPVSMHPHGVRYDKDSEGAYYEPNPGRGAGVGYQAKYTYVWKLDENSGPRPNEPSSKAWLYHSHVRGDEDANLGLVGFIIVTDPARARPDGTPADVDREMAALMMVFQDSPDENPEEEAAEAEEYARFGMTPPPPKPWPQLQESLELGQRHAINGRLFGNLRGLDMNEGERVRWYLFGLGSEEDFHTAHWHGLTVLDQHSQRTDVIELLPASMKVADMRADNPGSWLFHCHVAEHMARGMFANFTIHPTNAPVSRDPAKAFFGMRAAEESLRLTRAQITGAGDDCRINLAGECTVYQAFSVFVDPLVLHVGDKKVTFKLDRQGKGALGTDTFRVKNASEHGVVYGGALQFEATLTGKEWCNLVRAESTQRIPVRVDVGNASHRASFDRQSALK